MNRRIILRSAYLAACMLLLFTSLRANQERQPNIILIMVDDMGYADLECYGSGVIRTPNIDRMAVEGIRFTDAYSGSCVCAPARSTLMTGRHAGHTSVRGNTGGIPLLDADVTIAEILKKAGYATGGFGKWGLGDIDTPGAPEKQGFDVFFGYYHQIHAHNYYPEYLVRNGQKVRLSGEKEERYSHYLILKEMLAFIRENRDRPFFCYAPWTPPHGKYQIPDSEPALKSYGDLEGSARVIAAMISMIDAHVGEVIELLKELEIDDDTIIFFCSDNGAGDRTEGVLN
ncbi:MAG: sulfatase-like hydrolase/transferase, partial [Bacteroidota bacterium]